MEDDDVVLEKQDEFEAAYNFRYATAALMMLYVPETPPSLCPCRNPCAIHCHRFEEEGGSQIVTHARNIEGTCAEGCGTPVIPSLCYVTF